MLKSESAPASRSPDASEEPARASLSSEFPTPRVANAQTVFDKFCVANWLIFLIASEDIASRRFTSCLGMVANDQAKFAISWGIKSDSRAIEADEIDAISGSSVKRIFEKAQAVFARL